MRHRFCARQCASWLLLSVTSSLPLLSQAQTVDQVSSSDTTVKHARMSATKAKPRPRTLGQVKVEGQTSSTYSDNDSAAATRLPLSLLDTPPSHRHSVV